MTKVEVVVLAGAMPSSIAITLDILATANRVRATAGRGAAFSVALSGSGSRLAATMARNSGLELAARATPTDLVIVPGLAAATESEIAPRLGRPDAVRARQAIVAAVSRGAVVAASCSGVFLIGAAGLLEGKRATTTWWLAPLFRQMFPAVGLDSEAMVVSDGAVVTAGAAMAHLDLMLSLVARFAGSRTASACARYLLLDARHSQARYMAISYLTAADEEVGRAERWALDRLEEGFTVDELASAAGMSPRTFARRVLRATGLPPVRFVQRLRVERAMELIETTRLPFEEIARRVGYAEATTLRRAMRRDDGQGARDLRAGVRLRS